MSLIGSLTSAAIGAIASGYLASRSSRTALILNSGSGFRRLRTTSSNEICWADTAGGNTASRAGNTRHRNLGLFMGTLAGGTNSVAETEALTLGKTEKIESTPNSTTPNSQPTPNAHFQPPSWRYWELGLGDWEYVWELGVAELGVSFCSFRKRSRGPRRGRPGDTGRCVRLRPVPPAPACRGRSDVRPLHRPRVRGRRSSPPS